MHEQWGQFLVKEKIFERNDDIFFDLPPVTSRYWNKLTIWSGLKNFTSNCGLFFLSDEIFRVLKKSIKKWSNVVDLTQKVWYKTFFLALEA